MSSLDKQAEVLTEINRGLKHLYKIQACSQADLRETNRKIKELESRRGMAILELTDAAKE